MAVDRGLIKWVLVLAAVVFAALWLVSALDSSYSQPSWGPPVGVLCLAVAVALPLTAGPGPACSGSPAR
jgi:hypothetical protein